MKTHDIDVSSEETIAAVKARLGDDSSTRETIASLLANGLKTQTEPFPETEKEFHCIQAQLAELDEYDLEGKLVISGMLNHPYGPDQQRCMECMYFLGHRKWCDVPERALPAEPDWWCRLWRI